MAGKPTNGAQFVMEALCHSALTCPFTTHEKPAFPYPNNTGESDVPLVDPDFWHILVECMNARSIRMTANFGLNPRDSLSAEDRLRNLGTPIVPNAATKSTAGQGGKKPNNSSGTAVSGGNRGPSKGGKGGKGQHN